MPWTDPTAAIGVDKPIRASIHLAMFQNFAALAAGDPSAPRVRLPQAARTDETNQNLVLRPNGAGGVGWGNAPGLTSSWNSGPSGTTGLTVASGTYLVLAHGRRPVVNRDAEARSGFALVSGDKILFQSTVTIEADPDMSTGAFSIEAGAVYFYKAFGGITVRMLAIKIG